MKPACFLALVFVLSIFGIQQTQPEIAEHAGRAAKAIRENQADVAAQELEALLRIDPKNVNARASLGMVSFTQGDYARAAQQFKAALALSPLLWNAEAFLGICEIRLGTAEEGQRLIETSLEHVTDPLLRKKAGLELIGSYSNLGELRKALPIISLLEDHDPSDSEIQYSAYQLYSALAASALEKLSDAGEDSARIHQVLAQSFMTQDKYSQAVQEYAKALERDPRLPGLHLGKGEAVLAEGPTEENRQQAADDFRTELAIDPSNADAAFQLGQLCYQKSDFSEARQFLMRAVALRPNFTEAHIVLGLVLVRMGNEDAGLAEFKWAAKQDPNNRMAHYHLAQLHKKRGHTEEADRELNLFRRLSQTQNAKKPSVEIDQLQDK